MLLSTIIWEQQVNKSMYYFVMNLKNYLWYIKEYKSYEDYLQDYFHHSHKGVYHDPLIYLARKKKKMRERRKPLSNMDPDKKWIFFSLAFLEYGMFS